MRPGLLFASDLDNTLIHSRKTAKVGDVCVEIRDGQELSFMSRKAYGLLKDVAAKCTFVPVTTRSLEQYHRLDLGVKPRYAIVAHGALLLKNGEVDAQWASETRRLLNVTLPKIERNSLLFDVRYVEELFIFAKSENTPQAVKYLQTLVDEKIFDVCAVHNKVYILPAGLNKGMAVNRLKERLSARRLVCAGDSTLDLSMLEMADVAIAPKTLALQRKHVYTFSEEDSASELLRVVKETI
jgi:HAD superfamily hydrolase (TIGR01484 family)